MKNPSLPQCLWGFDRPSSWLAGEGGSTYDNFTRKKNIYLSLEQCCGSVYGSGKMSVPDLDARFDEHLYYLVIYNTTY